MLKTMPGRMLSLAKIKYMGEYIFGAEGVVASAAGTDCRCGSLHPCTSQPICCNQAYDLVLSWICMASGRCGNFSLMGRIF